MSCRIDIHTHVFHEKIADKAVQHLADHYKLGQPYPGTAADLKQKLDDAGIDKAVALCAATNAAQVIPANNWAITMKKNYPYFIPFGTLHTDYADWKSEMDRLYAAGIRGLKFHPDFQKIDMLNPVLYDMMEEAKGKFTVLFHVGDVFPPEVNYSSPQKLAKILKAVPGIEVVAAHLGGYRHWPWVVESLKGLDFYMDTSSALLYIDDENLKNIMNNFPHECFLFGSDYPIGDPAREVGLVRKRLGFSEDELEKLFTRASGLIGLKD